MQALSGVKVVEIGEMVSAPYAARLLAGMGAEVIKMERPQSGDRARRMGPFPGDQPDFEQSGLFLYLNTNKLGITLDISRPAGFEILARLVAASDVLIHNVPPPEMDRIGLKYERLRKINPKLIMTSISPFGSDGPYRDYEAEDFTLWNAGGACYINGVGIAAPDLPPLRTFGTPAGYCGGAHAAVATMGALITRELNGEGQHVEVMIQEAMVATALGLTHWSFNHYIMSRANKALMPAPLEAMEAKDGWVWIQTLEEHQWREFVTLMGDPQWAPIPDTVTE